MRYPLQDYVICEVTSATEAVCTDRAPTGGRELPELDDVEPDLDVTEVTIDDAGWTTVTFVKAQAPLDEQDYDLGQVCVCVCVTRIVCLLHACPEVLLPERFCSHPLQGHPFAFAAMFPLLSTAAPGLTCPKELFCQGFIGRSAAPRKCAETMYIPVQ